MISNLPTLTVHKITVEIDIALAETQLSRITDVLRNREYQLSRAERVALDGTRNLLAAVTDTEVRPVKPAKKRGEAKHITHSDVNRIRDLCMIGKTPGKIAKQMGYRTLAVARLLNGQTYAAVPYEPSEFSKGFNLNKLAGTDAYPWTEAWKVES